jgi:hypothetical protein
MPWRLVCSHRRIILLFHRGCVGEAAAGWHGRPLLAPFPNPLPAPAFRKGPT